jgi:hypothetical protein
MFHTQSKKQHGAELVEFMIILPVILVVAFMLFELGGGFVNKAVLANASRAAAREVIRGATPDEASQVAKAAWESRLSAFSDDPSVPPEVIVCPPSSDPKCTIDTTVCPSAPYPPGCEREVIVTQDFEFFFLPYFLSDLVDIELTARTVMREQAH